MRNVNTFLVKVETNKRSRYLPVFATDGRDAVEKVRPRMKGERVLGVFVQIHEGDYEGQDS